MARVISANAIPQISGYGIAGAGIPAAAYSAYAAPVYGGAAATVVAPTYAAPVQATSPFLSSAVVPTVAPRIDDVLGYSGYGVGVVPAGLNGAYLNSSLYGGRSLVPAAGYYGYSSAAGLGVPAYSAGVVPTYGATAYGAPAYAAPAYGAAAYGATALNGGLISGIGATTINGGLVSGIGAPAYVNNALPTYGAAYAPQYFGGYGGYPVVGNGVAVAQL